MTKHKLPRRPVWYLVMLQMTQPSGGAVFAATVPLQCALGYAFYTSFGGGLTMQILTACIFVICIVLATERNRYLYQKSTQREQGE